MACFMTSFVLMVEHTSHKFSTLVGIGGHKYLNSV